MFDAIKFYEDHSIDYLQEGHKHCRPGWVQIKCPFCHSYSDGWHLGYCYDPSDEYAGAYVCWKCKGKNPVNVISKLLGVTKTRASKIFRQYKGRAKVIHRKRERIVIPRRPSPIKPPPGARPLLEVPPAVRYLKEQRRYDAEELVETWGVTATVGLGEYSHRIIVPVTLHGILVSYQGRDYSGLSSIKYKACSKEKESVHHKNIIGGLDQALEHGIEHVVAVEGSFDAFRLGPGAVWLFGVAYRRPQVAMLAKYFKGVTVLVDGGEPGARAQSRKICADLSQRGLSVAEAFLDEGDPDDLPDEDARKLAAKLIK